MTFHLKSIRYQIVIFSILYFNVAEESSTVGETTTFAETTTGEESTTVGQTTSVAETTTGEFSTTDVETTTVAQTTTVEESTTGNVSIFITIA